MPLRYIIILLIILTSKTVSAQSSQKEADLKAVFIYNFTLYIEWDTASISGDFIIATLGTSEINASLIEVAKTHRVNGRKIRIVKYDKPENISQCHILFIPNQASFRLESILKNTGKGTLTISEATGYAHMGTALNFVVKNDKLRFEANLKSLDMAGLKASSQLLKLAIIVNQQK